MSKWEELATLTWDDLKNTTWNEVRLGEVVDIISGYAFKASDFKEQGDIPVIKIANINHFDVDIYKNTSYVDKEFLNVLDDKFIVKRDDILISLTGSNINQPNSVVGRVGKYREENYSVLNQRAGKIIARSNAYKEYIFHLFSTVPMTYQIASAAYGGANQVNISPSIIKKFKIRIPDLKTQEKIADVLSTYDELIENNNRRIEILEKAAEEIYKEWFVRLRFPGHEKSKFINGIPEGWEVRKIGEVVNITSSKRIYYSDYVEEGIPFYRSKEVIQLFRGELISDILYISHEKYREIKKKFGVPIEKDILLTSVGTIGVPMLIKNNTPFYFKDGNLIWFQSSSSPQIALYLYLWLQSSIGQEQLISSSIGTSQSALTIKNLKNIKIMIPSNDLLVKVNSIINGIIKKTNNLVDKNQNLIKQRDLLLPRLMNGTIEVK